ncbi:DUF6541 family protein, partial [Vibrio parahaemolyticus]
PLAALTIVVVGIALLLRRFAGHDAAAPRGTGLVALGALAVTAAVTTVLFARAFGSADNIAQRFDNIVHLNAIAFALQN